MCDIITSAKYKMHCKYTRFPEELKIMVQLLLPIIYISFISLGLPDSLLGSAWPSMYPVLGVPVSYAGLISMIISFGTIVPA